MFSAISNLFGYLLNFLYELVNNNFGVAIILFSILLRIILLPITIKQQKSMQKTNKIQGKIKELQFKYKNNPEMLNKETMELYKREKISPFSGCLSAIIQIIVILSVFYLVSRPLTYMKKVDESVIDNYKTEIKEEYGSISNYYEIEIIQKKASENEAVNINMNFLGLDLSKVPNKNLNDITVYIIPALYVISSFISIKLTTSAQNKKKSDESSENEVDTMTQMNKSMSYMMPIMAVSIAFIAPLGLALYWFVSNVLMICERIIIKKIVDTKGAEENA
jgi:YidC/Oxa1 family membrane protein insertase